MKFPRTFAFRLLPLTNDPAAAGRGWWSPAARTPGTDRDPKKELCSTWFRRHFDIQPTADRTWLTVYDSPGKYRHAVTLADRGLPGYTYSVLVKSSKSRSTMPSAPWMKKFFGKKIYVGVEYQEPAA